MNIKSLVNKKHEEYFVGYDDGFEFYSMEEFSDLEEAKKFLKSSNSKQKLYLIKKTTTFDLEEV